MAYYYKTKDGIYLDTLPPSSYIFIEKQQTKDYIVETYLPLTLATFKYLFKEFNIEVTSIQLATPYFVGKEYLIYLLNTGHHCYISPTLTGYVINFYGEIVNKELATKMDMGFTDIPSIFKSFNTMEGCLDLCKEFFQLVVNSNTKRCHSILKH